MPKDIGYKHGGDVGVKELVMAFLEALNKNQLENGGQVSASGNRRLENVEAEKRRSFQEGGEVVNQRVPQQTLGKLAQATQSPSAFSQLVEIITKLINLQTDPNREKTGITGVRG